MAHTVDKLRRRTALAVFLASNLTFHPARLTVTNASISFNPDIGEVGGAKGQADRELGAAFSQGIDY
jgi:hypothetical protein